MTDPNILNFGSVTDPLHGVNARNIEPKLIWNEIAQKSYKKYNYHCAACGELPKYVEAHEIIKPIGNHKFSYLYEEPLCRFCHLAIHPGYMNIQISENNMSVEDGFNIYTRAFNLLLEAGLPVNFNLIGNFNAVFPSLLDTPDCYSNLLSSGLLLEIPILYKEYPEEYLNINDVSSEEWCTYRLIYKEKEYGPVCTKENHSKFWANNGTKKAKSILKNRVGE